MRPGIRRVDLFVRHLRRTVLADHRLEESLRVVDVVETEAALHAKPVLVGGSVFAGDRDDFVVLDLISQLAPDAAVWTDAVDRTIGLTLIEVVVVDHRRRHQRPGRTRLHALATGDTGRSAHRIVEIEHDLLGVAAAGHADDAVDLHFATGANTQIALNAGVEIDRHRHMAAVRLRNFSTLALGEAAVLCVKFRGRLPELGIRIVGDLNVGLVGKQELRNHFTRSLGAIGLRLDLHARRRHANAARRQYPLTVDLDHENAAIAVGPVTRLWRIAQVRQVDAEAAGGAKDRLALADVDLA